MQIRVENTSLYTLDSIWVNSPGGEQVYGPLAPGEVSGYTPFAFTYRYAYVAVKTEVEAFPIVPIDYVGESKFEQGNFTYSLSNNLEVPDHGFLVGELKRD